MPSVKVSKSGLYWPSNCFNYNCRLLFTHHHWGFQKSPTEIAKNHAKFEKDAKKTKRDFADFRGWKRKRKKTSHGGTEITEGKKNHAKDAKIAKGKKREDLTQRHKDIKKKWKKSRRMIQEEEKEEDITQRHSSKLITRRTLKTQRKRSTNILQIPNFHYIFD